MRSSGRRSLILQLVAGLTSAVLCLGCPPKPKDADLPDGKVTSIDAAPPEVQVAPGQPPAVKSREFRLYAWYRDGDSIVAGRNDAKEWKVFDNDGNAPDGEVSIRTFPATGSQHAEVRTWKKNDEHVADTVKLTLWADAQAAKAQGDVVEAPHDAGYAPSAVLLEEKGTSGCSWGTPRSFVGAAAVNEQSDNPCSLALFSARRGVLFQENRGGGQWATGAWNVKGAGFTLKPDTLLELKVHVFLAVSLTQPSVAQSPASPLLILR